MTMKEEFNQLIQAAEDICIVGHTNPDGDCLGSTLGTRAYIKKRFPEKRVNVYLQEANAKFAYLPGFDSIIHIPSERKYDLCIMCDCAGFDRLGDYGVLAKNAAELYVADHHVTNDTRYAHASIFPEASSTCEVVFDLMEQEDIDLDTATCLYTGLVHDTGVFKYSCTSKHTMEIAGFLMGLGVDFGNIIDDSFYMRSYVQQQVTGRVLMESLLLMEKRILAGWITLKEMHFYHVTTKDIDGIVGTMRETRDVDGAVFAYEVGNQVYKVSLRSNNPMLDVARVAQAFGGGGHKMAAGCTLQGSYHDVLNNVMKQLSLQMDAPEFQSRRPADEK